MKPTFFFLPFLILSSLAGAQNSQRGELHFNHLYVKDGVPEGRVNSILQDNDGYRWIATQKGLVRDDGYRPKVHNFDLGDPYRQHVEIVYLDWEGRLWPGGNAGTLFLYQLSEDQFIPDKTNLSASHFSSRS